MKFTTRIASAVLAAGLLTPAAALLAQGPPPPPPGYAQGPGGWDSPPDSFRRDVQRRGFRDGIDGARRDAENRRPPNVLNRDEYRNYRGPDRRAYRQAFQAGYNTFWQHEGPGRRY